MLLRARIVLPLTAPPLEDGALFIAGGRLAAVGRWRDVTRHFPKAQARDLGEVLLLPGLVNAHCHLDYTALAGRIPPPRRFPDWIKNILAYKAAWGYAEYAQSWIAGAKMLSRTGTTTVADIEAVPALLPEVWETTPLRVFSLLEMTGLRSRRPSADLLGEAVE